MSQPKTVRAFAPATAANLACGFDVLGLALMSPGDEVIAKISEQDGPVRIERIAGDGGVLPLDTARNTAAVAVQALFDHVRFTKSVNLTILKGMPLGSGMGSSAASAVAGVVAANALLPSPLPKDALLPFVMEAERIACGSGHADNVAPSLLGGIVLIQSYEPLRLVKLPVPDGLAVVVVHPMLEVKTSTSRAILRKQVLLKDAVAQSGYLAGFVASCYTSDLDLMAASLHDLIAEPVRSPLIPNFIAVQKAAIEAGALGCSISGSGPSIFAMAPSAEVAQNIGLAMQAAFAQIDVQSTIHAGLINNEGAKVIEMN